VFSGFGAARPATTTAPLGRARRAIPSNTKPNAAAAAGGGQSRIHTAPAGGSTASASSSSLRHPPPASSSSLSTALIASGPSGPCVPGNLGTWMEWLGVDRRRKEDDKLMPIVQAASQAKTPAGWSLVNGWWINSKTGQQHKRHPYVKHFLSKIESKRLALKFSIEEDDDEDNDESLVASGDESTMPPGTPSSMHNRSGLFDESFNPLSPGPMSPKTRKIEATSHPAGQPPLMPVKMTGQQQQQPGSLSINTASASTVGAPPTHANMTPSPYYPGAPSAGFTPTASAPGSGLDSTTSSGLPSRGTTLQKLESVPERNAHAGGASSGGSVEALMGQATREKQARLAESERQMQERLAAAAAASSSTPYSTGVSGDSDRIISDLQNQVRLQSITIEELEKRKRALVYELENADVHLAQLLSEQRSRYEGQLIDQERRLRLEFDARRIDWQRTELSQQSQLAELEERLKGFEQRKTAAVTQAVHDAETKAREAMEHAVRLAQQNAESQRVHFERELESARLLHQQELQSLKQQHHDSTFLRSLVTQVENSAANVEGLAKKVYAERNASERMTFEQLTVRDGLLKEKELSLEQERRQNAELVQTYQKLTREHEEEKIRLREEHLRLQTLQHDIKSESAILQEQLSSERDQLRKERAALQQHREVWEIRQKREAAELELKKEMNERQHGECARAMHARLLRDASLLRFLVLIFCSVVWWLFLQSKRWRVSKRLSVSARKFSSSWMTSAKKFVSRSQCKSVASAR
jgi:hypothetical protein